MSHRLGVCSSCDAKYKIPASFTASQAKCKSCGGVVNISNPMSEAPKASAAPPVPARKVAPKPAPASEAKPQPKSVPKPDEMVEVKGSGKKRSGPSMKERLLAQREADAAAAAAKAKPATKPRTSKAPARAATKPTSSSRSAAPARDGDAKPKKPTGRSSRSTSAGDTGTSRRSGARRGRSSRDSESPEEEGQSRRRRGAARKKSSPMPTLIALALVVLAGVGAFLYIQQDTGPVAAGDGENVTPTTDEVSSAEAVNPNAATDEGNAESLATETIEETPVEPEAETTPKPQNKAAKDDPASIDLTQIEDFGPVDETTDEEFATLTELTDTMVDLEAGAAGNQARKTLTEKGRIAFPTLVNKLKSLDFQTEQGYRDGDIIQATLRDICGGMSFGWRYSTEPKDVAYNKKAVRNWISNWTVAQSDPVHWEAMTKQAAKKAEKPKAEESMNELDDLEDF